MNPYELTARRNALQTLVEKITEEKRQIELVIIGELVDRKEYDLLKPNYTRLNRVVKRDEEIQAKTRQYVEDTIFPWLTD